ncbi:MAG: hypothetical protein AAF694_11880 [Bacteroidota bacterium]
MKKSPFLSVFGAIIAYVLFLLYGGILIYMMVEVVNRGMQLSANPDLKFDDFHDGLTYVVTTIGGLVSALVIAHLAITPTGEDPAKVLTKGIEVEMQKRGGFESVDTVLIKKTLARSQTLIWIYLAGWLILGLSALIVGVLFYPEVDKTVSDLGTTWLGLAVSAAFSYFGLTSEEGK